MSKEIKMNYGEVEAALNKLKASTNQLTVSPKEIPGYNNLEVVDKLIELNEGLHNLTKVYKKQLLANIGSTNESISALKEADELLSSSIKHK